MGSPARLILASTSRYRKGLLERLGLPFDCVDPAVPEGAKPGELPARTAVRLALAKARAVALRYPEALVIGSDQVASLEGAVLEKPGNHANATSQLRKLSGCSAQFDTAVALVDAHQAFERARLVPCRVSFRNLTDQT